MFIDVFLNKLSYILAFNEHSTSYGIKLLYFGEEKNTSYFNNFRNIYFNGCILAVSLLRSLINSFLLFL